MAAPAYDYLDRRVLAALRFVDALGLPIGSPVAVKAAEGVALLRKRSGEVVVMRAPGLASHSDAFLAPPAAPAVGSITLQLDLRPASPEYGARRFALKLPRDPDPAQAATPASLFRPVEVELLPTPCARPTGLVAALSVTVRRSDDQRRVAGALVRLRPEGGRPPARAFTDAAGDALLLIPGVPLTSPGPGATVLADLAGALDAIVDPALARFIADDALDAARAAAPPAPIDPDDLESRLAASATTAVAVRIAAGRTRTAAISWTPP